jgi:hypothetical protein
LGLPVCRVGRRLFALHAGGTGNSLPVAESQEVLLSTQSNGPCQIYPEGSIKFARIGLSTNVVQDLLSCGHRQRVAAVTRVTRAGLEMSNDKIQNAK